METEYSLGELAGITREQKYLISLTLIKEYSYALF